MKLLVLKINGKKEVDSMEKWLQRKQSDLCVLVSEKKISGSIWGIIGLFIKSLLSTGLNHSMYMEKDIVWGWLFVPKWSRVNKAFQGFMKALLNK